MLRMLRKFFRRRMKPISTTSAINTKEKLSLLYMFAAWNVLCVSGYYFFRSDRSKEKDNTGRAWAQYLGLKNVTIHRYDGISKTGVEVISQQNND